MQSMGATHSYALQLLSPFAMPCEYLVSRLGLGITNLGEQSTLLAPRSLAWHSGS